MSKQAEEFIDRHSEWQELDREIAVEILDKLWTIIEKRVDDLLLYGTNGKSDITRRYRPQGALD